MGSSSPPPHSSFTDDETVLFLFLAFGILIALLILVVLSACQTWMLWKMARAVVEGDGRMGNTSTYAGSTSASGFAASTVANGNGTVGYTGSQGEKRGVRASVRSGFGVDVEREDGSGEGDREGLVMSGGNGRRRTGGWI